MNRLRPVDPVRDPEPSTTTKTTTHTEIRTEALVKPPASSSSSHASAQSPAVSAFTSSNSDQPSSLPASDTSNSNPVGASSKPNHLPAILAGVLVPLLLALLIIAGVIVYKRRRRVKDKEEWEKTHNAIADAVREMGVPGAPVSSSYAGGPWSRLDMASRGDMQYNHRGDSPSVKSAVVVEDPFVVPGEAYAEDHADAKSTDQHSEYPHSEYPQSAYHNTEYAHSAAFLLTNPMPGQDEPALADSRPSSIDSPRDSPNGLGFMPTYEYEPQSSTSASAGHESHSSQLPYRN